MAKIQYNQAKAKGNIEDMKKYASRTSRLTTEMINEAKDLVNALGCPVIQAPSEGEAQAAYIVNQGEAFAVVSEDYDSLLYGAKRILKNLSISGKTKQKGKLVYKIQGPIIIETEKNLQNWGISKEQLIILAILVGTDYNIGGVKGIGPKKAFKLVKEKNPEEIFSELDWSFDVSWKEIYNIFINMPTTDEYELVWNQPKLDNLKSMLSEHDFSEERINRIKDRLDKISKTKQQTGLGDFI